MFSTLHARLERATTFDQTTELMTEANNAFVADNLTTSELQLISVLFNKVRMRLALKRARVVLVEETNKDLGNAHIYGDVTVLMPKASHRPSIWEQEFIRHIEKRLNEIDFNPELDYLLVAGSQISTSTVIASLASKYSSFKVLFWHASIKEYLPRVFNFGVK